MLRSLRSAKPAQMRVFYSGADKQRAYKQVRGALRAQLDHLTGVQGVRTEGTEGLGGEGAHPVASGRTEQTGQVGETGPHGPILRQFHHDAQGALDHLLREVTGDAISGLHHPELGGFDLTADIAAKLRANHPEVIDNLQGFISWLEKVSESKNRIILASDNAQPRAAVRLDYDGVAKRWLLSAYDREAKRPTGETTDASGSRMREGTVAPSGRPPVPPSTERSIDVSGNPVSGASETAPSPNSGAPDTSMGVKQGGVNSTEEQTSLVSPRKENESRAAHQPGADRLTHDQLAAHLKSGGGVTFPGLKPAEGRGLSDQEGPMTADPRHILWVAAPPASSPPRWSHRPAWRRCLPAPPPERRCRPEFRWGSAR